MASYFSIKNHVTQEINHVYKDPTEAATDAIYSRPAFKDKESRRKWLASSKTHTAIVSAFEGLNADLRVSIKEGNPVALIHGVIVDYDAPHIGGARVLKSHLKQFYKDTPSLIPQWAVTTPSGFNRLVWEFAEPCSLIGCPDKFIVTFLAEFKKVCRLSSVLAGIDEAAYLKPSTYYDAAGEWQKINVDPFSVSDTDGVFFAAVKKSTRETDGSGLTEIPMDAVKDRLEELYPGRWPLSIPFVEGCRGPAVWDVNSSNPTTTIYTTKGAYRFSSCKGFHSYEEILGKDFVRQWEDNKLGQSAKSFYYMAAGSKNYFVRIGGVRGAWEPQQLGDIARRLVSGWKLSRKASAANEVSEVDQAIQYIQDFRKVSGVIPFVYDKRETVTLMNRTFLNNSMIRVLDPAPEAIFSDKMTEISPAGKHVYRWGDGFPWIASWLSSWFPLGSKRKQLVFLLAWLKQGYEGARRGEPQKGHAMFLVGGTNRGKTLFNGEFMDKIFGASTDASSFLLGKSGFNKELLESGFWRVDDAVACIDKAGHTKFTEEVKRFVANPTMEYHPKYVDAQSVPFNGRLCITLNEDEGSLRMIPDLDRNIADKLMILRLSDNTPKAAFRFPERHVITKLINAQTPYFLRWLINWEIPTVLTKGHTRFGMKNFIHERVRMASLSAGLDADFFDIMAPLWETDDEFKNIAYNKTSWVGSAAQLLIALMGNPLSSISARGLTPRILGKKLATLATLKGSGIVAADPKGNSRIRAYIISPPSFITAHEESVAY